MPTHLSNNQPQQTNKNLPNNQRMKVRRKPYQPIYLEKRRKEKKNCASLVGQLL